MGRDAQLGPDAFRRRSDGVGPEQLHRVGHGSHALVPMDGNHRALHGGFAQLAPCWNWQLNGRYPLVPMRYPVFLRHFVSDVKPDRDSSGWHEARFNQAYRDFLTNFMPDGLGKLAAPCNPAVMTFKDASRIVLRHVMGARLVSDVLARHPDPYRARV